ncbi:hypothetical protein B5F76_12600 [Desulfovibrio sp. An276]|nr:hypothetical protein B5F76_12600 [Desulfovibrio sp. An276]
MRLSGLSPNPDDDEMALVIPNREIHDLFAEEANKWFRDVVGKRSRTGSLGERWGQFCQDAGTPYCKLLATAKIWQRPGTKTAVQSS